MKRLVPLIMALLLLSACTKPIHKSHKSMYCMDTVMDLQIWSTDPDGDAQAIRDLLMDLEATWDPASSTSAIAELDRGGDGLTPEQKELIGRIEALSQRTGGAFDPTLYAVTEAWGFPTDSYCVPTPEQLEDALAMDRWDLGAAMKGYAGMCCVEKLSQLGSDRALLDLGGNIQTFGSKRDGSAWMIGIRSPEGDDTIGTVAVHGTMSVITSGDYQRYFEVDGKRYSHILDPKTGYPADSGISSVTVISRDGLVADVMSTALFVMGLEEATRLWQESDDFEAVFLLTTGEVYATEGVTLTGCDHEVIHREK